MHILNQRTALLPEKFVKIIRSKSARCNLTEKKQFMTYAENMTSASPVGLPWLLKIMDMSTGSTTELNHSAMSFSVTRKGRPRM